MWGLYDNASNPRLADDIFKTLAQPGIRPHIDVAGFLVGNVNQTTFRRAMWFAAIGIAAGSALVAAIGMAGLWVSVAVAIAVACLGMLLPGNAPELNDSVSLIDGGQHHVPRVARDVFERLPDPLMLLGSGGRVAYANDAMRALVGIDVENKPVSAVLRTPAVLEAIDHASETGEQSSFEFVLHVPVERHYSAYVSRAQDAPRLTALLLHDLTAVKRAEEARADFIANASHELRTPLAAVSGFIDTLRGHAKDDEEARDKFLHIMSVEAGRMRRLIEDLLSLTRIELNEHVPPAGQADVTSVVRDAAAILGPLAEADGVTVTVENTAPVPLVVGERDELMQLFQNLIHNAIKYGKRGGHVWIDIEPAASPAPGRGQAESMIAIRIRDDGEGVAREAIPRLTERFYRVDVKRSRERGGTGLGLAIVKHIIARHQGRLQIESEVGEGSTFTVFLPAMEKGATVTELL